MAVERDDVSGDDQYVLRMVRKRDDGSYRLQANNPDYADFDATEGMRPQILLRRQKELLPLKIWWSGEMKRSDQWRLSINLGLQRGKGLSIHRREIDGFETVFGRVTYLFNGLRQIQLLELSRWPKV